MDATCTNNDKLFKTFFILFFLHVFMRGLTSNEIQPEDERLVGIGY